MPVQCTSAGLTGRGLWQPDATNYVFYRKRDVPQDASEMSGSEIREICAETSAAVHIQRCQRGRTVREQMRLNIDEFPLLDDEAPTSRVPRELDGAAVESVEDECDTAKFVSMAPEEVTQPRSLVRPHPRRRHVGSPKSSRSSPRSPRKSSQAGGQEITQTEWEDAREIRFREAKLKPLPDPSKEHSNGVVTNWEVFRTPPTCVVTDAEVIKQTREAHDLISQKAAFKFRNVRDAFRLVDVDKSGSVTRREMHIFFRQFNLPKRQADLLFDELDQDDSGEIDYVEFMDHFGSVIQPGSGGFRATHYKSPMEGAPIHANNAVGWSLRKLG
eukprot:GEMP01015361.1.p1 GENE.GEMP01015361.1~~GEMP01015361.1.p1  ORF type:complete len:329 (-),score=61.39 GEMP01015361.1:1852-2838(-)